MKIPASELRWHCDPDWLGFESTREVEPTAGVIGQDDAMEALKFGLETSAPGQNIFVRGLTGTGRMSLVQQLLQEIHPAAPQTDDRLYVHNFAHADRPRLITLPRGQGHPFHDRMERFVAFVEEELVPALASEGIRAQVTALEDRLQQRLRVLGRPFEQELTDNGLALVPIRIGSTMQPVIMPVIDGEPAPPERVRQLRQEAKISDAEIQELQEKVDRFSQRFQELGEKFEEAQSDHRNEVDQLYEREARSILTREVNRIQTMFPYEPVKEFLAQIVDDLVLQRLRTIEKDRSFTRKYRVNVVLGRRADEPSPIIVENTPTLQNLLGNIERRFTEGPVGTTDHLMIRGGTLLRADGGYLILEARDVLSEPGAWKVLIRTLRTGKLEIVPTDFSLFSVGSHLKPEPIDVEIKVILLGDPGLYYLLDAYDLDFPYLFKVLADFDTTIARDEEGVQFYARVLAKVVGQEGLVHFSRDAVAGLCEHGARIAARGGRLTARFGRLADIAREASFIARKESDELVEGRHVSEAIVRTRRRADLPARRFRKLVSEGTIRIEVDGSQVGQVNGLAVIHAGPLTYGFPTRITATVGAGTSGAINIEREADLSGSIHTKGFYILGGLLRRLLRSDHPLAFSASVAFEQSYGGIDGDSASGAEICCLLSALTGIPLRQDLAMTGAIDQMGHIEPVGAVTEKIEGFFRIVRDIGLTGTQGVIIPKGNRGDLMLSREVVKAVEEGQFHVFAVETVQEALALFTGQETGEPDENGDYPEGTLLHVAREKARDFWNMVAAAGGGD